jgi:hypothetical protein
MPGAPPECNAQRIVADKLPRPQALEQLLIGDHAQAVLHEISEDIEDLRSQGHKLPSAPQFIALGIEAVVPKHIAHRPVSSPSLRGAIPPYQLPSGQTSYEMRAHGVQLEARAVSATYRRRVGKISACCRVTRPW